MLSDGVLSDGVLSDGAATARGGTGPGTRPGHAADQVVLRTLGHGTLDQSALTDLLVGAGLAQVVDIRRAPGSRRHPHVARDALARWLPAAGIGYRWEPGLGGWRRAGAASPNTALRNESFRGYADYMQTAEFWAALDGVLAGAAVQPTAVMCSETLWWRCHRRLVADAAVLGRGAAVLHLGHDGRDTVHRLTGGARWAGHQVVYDGGAATLGSG